MDVKNDKMKKHISKMTKTKIKTDKNDKKSKNVKNAKMTEITK